MELELTYRLDFSHIDLLTKLDQFVATALIATFGDVNAAVERLLSSGGQLTHS